MSEPSSTVSENGRQAGRADGVYHEYKSNSAAIRGVDASVHSKPRYRLKERDGPAPSSTDSNAAETSFRISTLRRLPVLQAFRASTNDETITAA